MLPEEIDIISVKPEKKDFDRADRLRYQGKTFKGSGEPFVSEASKMAKLIKDNLKMVRRAKAVAATYGGFKYDPYRGNAGRYTPGLDGQGTEYSAIIAPFVDAMKKLGFTSGQIYNTIKSGNEIEAEAVF